MLCICLATTPAGPRLIALGEQLLTVRERFRQVQTADPLARDQVPELPLAM